MPLNVMDAHFDSFETVDSARPELGLLNLAGNLLPLAPHWTTDIAAYYDLPITLLPGRYRLWCGIANHRALGMQATLIVTPTPG